MVAYLRPVADERFPPCLDPVTRHGLIPVSMLQRIVAGFGRQGSRGAAETDNSSMELDHGADIVATPSQHCSHNVATQCRHCAEIAEAEWRLRANPEPVYLEPHEHAEYVLEALQDEGKSGPVLSDAILNLYDELVGHLNIQSICERDLLREMGKLVKKSRPTFRLEDGDTTTRTAYIIPRPKAAVVVPMRRRQSA